jgi:adenosylmethionine-8-amino-7-oxononanoate aminotransferase
VDMPQQQRAPDRDAARRHLIPHFTQSALWHEVDWPLAERGEGAYVWTSDGTRYLDGLSGLFCTNLGHGRADLVAAMAEQAGTLPYVPSWNMTHAAAVEAAEAVARFAPAGLDQVFFVSSGSEAVDSAMKLARCHHVARGEAERTKVIARRWAYHGTTLGALAATGVPRLRAPFEPMLFDGVVHVANTAEVRATAGSPADHARLAADAVERAILDAGPETVSMVIVEPVQNGGGAIVPPTGYWAELRRICDRHGVLLCADEVICAFGRLGAPFGSDRVGAAPDLVTFAKGATSAYAPMGGVVARRSVVEAIADSPLGSFVHGSTFGAHPVAAAVAVANIRALEEEHVVDRVIGLEGVLRTGLDALAAAHDTVHEVRGCGFFYAIELARSRERGLALTEDQARDLLGGRLTRWIWDERLLIRADDRGATSLVLAPPLICGAAELAELLDGVSGVLDRVDAHLAAGPTGDGS